VLLLTGMLTVCVPGWLTADLKRSQQPNWYLGLGLVFFLICAGVVWLAWRTDENCYRSRWRWLTLAGLVVLPNLGNIWLRTTWIAPGNAVPGSLFGRDGDVQLFYSYGHQFAAGFWPKNFQGQYMEYPQFALFLFLGGAILAGSLDTFVWLFPSLILLFELGAAFALFGIGLKQNQPRAAYIFAVLLATCPFLYGFGYTRFDIAPTALLLAGIYFFLPAPKTPRSDAAKLKRVLVRTELSSGGIVAGVLAKWLPAIAWPWLAMVYVRKRLWLQLGVFVEVAVGLTAITLLPFYLWNSTAFWYPYQYQGSRHLIGESFWFLVQNFFLDPAHAVPDKPWAEPTHIFLGNNTLLAAQIALTLLLFGLSGWRLGRVRDDSEWARWAGAGLVGVAVFTLANRVFSPQYIVLLVWVWAAALLLRPLGWKKTLVGSAALIGASGANFLTFLLGAYPDGWVTASTMFFLIGFLLSGWLFYRLQAA